MKLSRLNIFLIIVLIILIPVFIGVVTYYNFILKGVEYIDMPTVIGERVVTCSGPKYAADFGQMVENLLRE